MVLYYLGLLPRHSIGGVLGASLFAVFSCTSFSKVAVEIGDSVVCRFAAGRPK